MKNIINENNININIPMNEPDRQYYFIERCADYVHKEEMRLGRKLTACIQTFGCQMNSRDSEKLMGILEEIGYIQTDKEEADFVIYNTCTVRESANLKIYGRLGFLQNIKKKNPKMIIALCGCMMQEEEVVKKIKNSYRFVDIIFGTHNIYKLAELIENRFTTRKMTIEILKSTEDIIEDLPTDRKYTFKSGVNIMFGCNNFCSYCIVPYVRGRERSRNSNDIIKEIEKLVADGVVEIMLLGQNVNSYGKNLESPKTFAQLLEEIEKINGLERVRFMTSHPKDLSDELIEVMKNSSKICNHLHLPLQSGSSHILEKMNRHYTKESYIELVEKIKRAIPNISLTTDIIVGFPGETDKDFEDTLEVIRKVGFDSAYTFIYSKRSGTPAADMEDQISKSIVDERFKRLLGEIKPIAKILNQRYLGDVVKVLVEEANSQNNELVSGRMTNNTVVHFKGNKELVGKIVLVRLDESKSFYYIGTMI